MTYEETLAQLADAHPNLVVMTAENRAVIRGLPQRLGPRFIDVGIAEQTMIGAAAGLAIMGRVPVVHALATFLVLRAFEFIRTDVGIASLPVKLVGGFAGFLSEANGPTHQAIEDISVLRGIPKMQVFCPADEEDLRLLLPAIIQSPAPAYLRFNASRPAVLHAPFEIGRAEVVKTGSEVVILTYGLLLEQAMSARQILEAKGVSTGVVNLRTLSPIDEATILEMAGRVSLVVTLEDHFLTGGLYSILAEVLLAHRTTADVLPIALEKRWFKPALLKDVLAFEGFTGEAIAERIWRKIR